MAIYQAQKMVQTYFPNYYNATTHRKYVFIDFSEKMSFADLVAMLKDMDPKRTLMSLFRAATRLKRGIVDTGYI